MKKNEKAISIILLISTLVFTLSACGAEAIKIEDYEWQMRMVIKNDSDLIVPAVGEADEVYPDAKVVDLTLIASTVKSR